MQRYFHIFSLIVALAMSADLTAAAPLSPLSTSQPSVKIIPGTFEFTNIYEDVDDGTPKYSDAKQITPENVNNLIRAWEFSTGDLDKRDPKTMRRSSMQATATLFFNELVVCTPFNEVIALDPATGKQIWRFDPKIQTDKVFPANKFNCRGVAVYITPSIVAGHCDNRIFSATNDARIFALDPFTGKRCKSFGTNGEVKIDPGMDLKWPGEFQITSAPIVIGNAVIVGSSIGDNNRVDAPHGTVRAYDTKTGKLKWTWDPIPRDDTDPATATWGGGNKNVGHANVWAPMSADGKRHLVFLPTSSPSPDFFGGLRPGDNKHANSVVALNAQTGKLVCHRARRSRV